MATDPGDAAQQPEPADATIDLGRVAALDLNLLVPLLAVIEERSVTRAAARVGLSQPAMSHALRRIRRVLGDQVIVRQGHQSALTPRALEMAGTLRRVVGESAGLLLGRAFDPLSDRRIITLAMATSTAFVTAPRFSRAIAASAPHATMRVLTTADFSDAVFTQQRADVLLISESLHTAHPREPLYSDRWVVICGEPFADPLEALRERPHVVYDSAVVPRPYQVLREKGVAYAVGDRVTDTLLMGRFVIGTGRVAIHRLSVAEVLAGYGTLHITEFPYPLPPLSMDLVWNPWLVDEGYRTWLRDTLFSALTA